MKALTIKEPWASLIINNIKKYEFRSWKTNYRGKLLIHAGLNVEQGYLEKFKSYNLDYKPGYILGEVELIDCIKVDDCFNKKLLKENSLVYGITNHVSNYAWKLDNIIIYEKPIKIKGKLGLWNYEK